MSTTKPQAITDVFFTEDTALFTARHDTAGAMILTVLPSATGLSLHVRVEEGVAIVTIGYEGDDTSDEAGQ